MMDADQAYRRLISSAASSSCNEFDAHAVAAIVALAVSEAKDGERSIAAGVGLDGNALNTLIKEMFPGAVDLVDAEAALVLPPIDAEEQSVRDILGMYVTGASWLERYLISMIARRCKSPHHLWQDLGLRDRKELSILMSRHFNRLADKNRNDMKWKKFLYRMVCGTEGFTLCTSPVCSECDDFKDCFGAEDGESRLAVARNTPPAAA